MNGRKINLLIAGNDYAFDGMLTDLISITKYCKECLCVYIFTMDLTDKNPKWKPVSIEQAKVLDGVVKKVNKDSEIILKDVTDVYRDTLEGNMSEGTQYTPYTLCRLLCDRVEGLPDKLLYIDTDIVAFDDISKLYDQDIEGYLLAGVKDYYGRVFINPNYINAGVLLFNLKAMNEANIFKKCRALLWMKNYKFSDQTVINKTCRGGIKYLPYIYNDQKILHKNTVIRHFAKTIIWMPYFHTRNIKPWQERKLHKYGIRYVDDILAEYNKIKEDIKNIQK